MSMFDELLPENPDDRDDENKDNFINRPSPHGDSSLPKGHFYVKKADMVSLIACELIKHSGEGGILSTWTRDGKTFVIDKGQVSEFFQDVIRLVNKSVNDSMTFKVHESFEDDPPIDMKDSDEDE